MAIVSNASAGARAAGRATIVQLRAPHSSARAIEAEAIALVTNSPVPVVVSSRSDIVLAAGAAGVNLPEHEVSVEDARTLLGDRLVGRSVHTLAGALRAEEEGADYVIFGPVWASPTHPAAPPTGTTALAEVARALHIPVLAIGGVTAERIAEIDAAGAAGYAAITLFQ